VSNAWVDGCSLRTYRHAPNTGSRKSWAAGDATSRGVRLALIAMTGEMGYPSALTAPTWGYYDVLFKGNEFQLQRPYGSYVMENVLFKISYPAEFHSQTAVEAGMTLHAQVKDRIGDIEKVVIETQEAGVRIIDKTGPLDNPADRDHCIQYMVAVPLIFGRLTAADYEDNVASDPRIDELRAKMRVKENPQYTKDYFDPQLRYIGNSVQVFFNDGTSTECVAVDFPIGHRERREEGIPVLKEKFVNSVSPRLGTKQWAELDALCADPEKLAATAVDDFMALLVV
jgi:2-methylcitrate dehydratase